jgi:hypothetical protein
MYSHFFSSILCIYLICNDYNNNCNIIKVYNCKQSYNEASLYESYNAIKES